MRLCRALLVAALLAVVSAQCNTGLANVSLPDNGNVCALLSDPDPVDTTCALAIGSGLNAALAACAADTFIEIRLTPQFYEAGPFFFPDVRGITLFGAGTSTLVGSEHVVMGNRTALSFFDLVFLGEGTEQLLFDPPLRSNNLTMEGTLVTGFHGIWTILQEACEEDTRLQVYDGYFFDNWGASLFHSGLYEYDVQNTVFDRCGGNEFGATFLKTNWVTRGTQVFYNNSQWLLFDEQPPTCVSYLDGGEHLRCRDGVFECENLGAAAAAGDCPQDVNKTFVDPMTMQLVSEMLYRPFCRRYGPCQCEEVIFRDLSNASATDFGLRVGDLIYPHVTLPCVPGSNLVGGGAIGSVAPLQFQDPSFEDFVFPVGNTKWNTSSAAVIRNNAVLKPKARTGSFRVICPGGQDSWFEQRVNFTAAGAYLLSFWGARRDGDRDRFTNAFIELYLDGVQQSTLQDPTFFNTLVSDLTYYEFLFPPINVGSAGERVLRIRCNFVNAPNGLDEFAIDDISSRASGLEVVLFQGGAGIGPPFASDPLDYIAGTPLTSDATITPLPCPACPPAPTRPPDLPCNYVILDTFECFRTVFDGDLVCLEPDIFNAGIGAFIVDSSFENATYYWTETTGSPVVVPTGTPGTFGADTGNFFVYGPSTRVVGIQTNVTFPGTAIYTLSVRALRTVASLPAYTGKFFRLYMDNVLMQTIGASQITSALPFSGIYGTILFDPMAVTVGVHTLRIEIDMTGGFLSAGLQLDNVQFVGSTASPSASQTPSASPTPSPSPSLMPLNGTNSTNATLPGNTTLIPTVDVLCNGTNITVACPGANVTFTCNGTNITVPCVPPPLYPPDQLRCIEEDVWLGEEPFSNGCIVPGNMPVLFNGQNVTANECMTSLAADGCVLPEMFSFVFNNTLIRCDSLSAGVMSCDCSVEKLLSLTNRTVRPGICAYEFDKVPATVTGLFIRDSRSQQLDYGGCSRRIEFDTVVRSSVSETDYFDERGVAREILRQNPRMWGKIPDATQDSGTRPGPRFLQDALPIYEKTCEDMCPMFNPTRLDTNIPYCVVDNAGADFDPTVYPTIQAALDDGACEGLDRAIWVRESENFYEENLVFERDNIQIFAVGNVTVIGVHEVRGDVNVLFFRGMRFVHNGRNGQPLFDIDKASDLRNLTILNCDFSGDGVKDGGVVRNRNRVIGIVDFQANLVRDFQTSVLRFTAVDLVIMDNTLIDCSGRLAQVRYEGTERVDNNVMIDSRGAPDIEKPALIELFYVGDAELPPCAESVDACSFRRNVQLEVAQSPEESEDFKETGILLRSGALFLETVRDNVIIKARTGLRLRRVTILVPEALLAQLGDNQFLEVLQFYNPQVRNTRTRRVNNGEDFMVDGFFEGSRISRRSCSFPDCVAPENQPHRCIVNLNFESLHAEQFGWEIFTNVTQAAFFCPLNEINVTVFGGARISPERWAVTRPKTNNIARPLLNEPTNEEIAVGDAPVPDRFVVRGADVDPNDVAYYAQVLDANTTYGFGLATQVFVRTDVVCRCPALNVIINQPVQYTTINCTTLVGPARDPDMCADLIASDPQVVACVAGADSDLECIPVGQTVVGALLVQVFDCQMPLLVTRNVSMVVNQTLVNGTLVNVTASVLVNSTEYVVQTGHAGNLELCDLQAQDVFRPEFELSTLNQCTEPVFFGVGSTFSALNISLQHMAFYLDYGVEYDQDEINVPMLSTSEAYVDGVFVDMRCNARGQEPPGRTEGFRFQQGLDVPDQLGRKKRNRRPPIASRSLLQRCVFERFLFFATTLNNAAGSADEESEVDEFPWINALDVEVINRLENDSTVIDVWQCNFTDVDRTSVRLKYANLTRFYDNFGQRVGGRSLDTPAAFWLEANPLATNAVIHMRNNNLTQTRAVTYPFLGDLALPAFQSMVWVTGLRDAAIFDCMQFNNATIDECLVLVYPQCCPALIIESSFWCGLPYGLRVVGEREVVTEYILRSVPGMPVPIFDDDLSAPRELALVNNVSIDGTVCDIVIGPPDQDWRKEHLCCQEACPPRAPSRCRINSEDPRIPGHPWENIYWFTDVNACPALCQASSGVCELEVPDSASPYQVRLDFQTTEPPVLVYEATWSGPVTITVLSTLPMAGMVSPTGVSVPIEWFDASLPSVFVEVLPGDPLLETLSIEVEGRLQLPGNVPEAAPTNTPAGWVMDIRVRYTFCAPGNMIAPVSSFPVSFAYMSPAINVNSPETPTPAYAAVLVVDWQWDATATLQTSTGRELRGVGGPVIQCNRHSVAGPDITVSDIYMMHGDPCQEPLDPVECPCVLPDGATWEQQDADATEHLVLRNLVWDGRAYDALAVDGLFWGNVRVSGSAFRDYRDAQPSYVVRLASSPTQDCCNQACVNDLRVVNNVFQGQDGVSMTGNVVRVGPTESAHVDRNTAEQAGFQETGHAEAALFFIESCPGQPLVGSMSENVAQRLSGAVVTDRVPANDCYWTAFAVNTLAAGATSFRIERNEHSQSPAPGAQICIRAVGWPGTGPSSDCQRPLRKLNAANPYCDGALWDSVKADCAKDVCLARTLGCPGVDPVCDAATIPPCATDDECLACEGICGRPAFDPPVWVIVLAAVIAAILLCYVLYCCGCLIVLCVAARPRTRKIRVRSTKRAPAIATIDERAMLLRQTQQMLGAT